MLKRTLPVLSLVTSIGISISYLAYLCKVGPITGTMQGFFSMNHAILPLLGAFCGSFGSIAYIVTKLCTNVCMLKTLYIPLSQVGLGTCAASLYWAKERYMVRIGIPALCFALFVLHPVGCGAVAYACLWFIPIFMAIFAPRNVFCSSLASTFTAHAVGSVIHLYTINAMCAEQWHALIMIALCERLIFACGMTIMYTLIHNGLQALKAYILKDMHAEPQW